MAKLLTFTARLLVTFLYLQIEPGLCQQQQQIENHQHHHYSSNHQPISFNQQQHPSFILTENFNSLYSQQQQQTTPTQQITTLKPDDETIQYPKKDSFFNHPTTTESSSLIIDTYNNNNDDKVGNVVADVPNTKTATTSSTNKCEFWLVSNEGNLTSFGDPSQSVNCVYRITPLNPTVCSVELHFNDFDVTDMRSEQKHKDAEQRQAVEKEFAQLSANRNSCVDNYLEFNNRKRYCHRDWNNRMDVVDIDPNYEKDFVFRLVLDRVVHSSGFNIKYKPLFDTCDKLTAKKLEKSKYENSNTNNNNNDHSIVDPVEMLASSLPSSSYCEKRHTEMEFEIKSANYPKNYSNNLDCVHYVIRKSENVCGLELKFIHFDIEESEGCAYDFFEIDGENFCGRLPNGSRNIFHFDTAVKSISFQTDSQVNGPGFHIKIRQINDCRNAFMPIETPAPASGNIRGGNQGRQQKCSILWHEREGKLGTLKYPDPYPNDLLCAYTIERNPHGHYCSIEMNFIDFDLQNTRDCSGDFFEIQNERYCGHSLRNERKIIPFNPDGYIRFLFKSDSTENGQGFLLNYTQIPCTKQMEDNVVMMNPAESLSKMMHDENSIHTEPCVKIYRDKKFDLISDTIDGHYKDNQNCHFTIKKYSDKVCYLEMHFKMFDLEASQDCQYDYMEIGSAVRLCGTLNQETSRIYVFDKPEMIINFHTDSTNERKGYRIHTEQLECQGDRIIREHYDHHHHHHHHEEPNEGLQSLEQYKFEQQQHYIQPTNDTQLLQQQENFVHQTSEFDPTIPEWKYLQNPSSSSSSLLCSKTFRQKEFFIDSPNFPDNYPPDLDCLFMIVPYSLDVCKIEINFDSFELQPYDFEKNCLKSDFLDFDNKEQFCGKMTETQSRIYSFRRNETFFIHFHSDSFRTSFDKGFRLYVRQIECSSLLNQPNKLPVKQQKPQQQQNHCSRILMSSSFDIQSPLYPSPYPSNSYCDYRIVKFKAPGVNVCFLEVHFIEFDLQSSTDCNKDYVSFNGIKQCGSIAKDSVRLFPFYDNEFTISFFADPLISGRGFFLKIRQNECPQTGHNDHGAKRIIKPPSSSSSLIMKDDPFSPYQIYHANQICQQTFGSTYFEFESPNYPQYYLPSLSCVYTIQRRHSRFCKLELYFTDFDIEPSTKCTEDYLLIDNVKYCNTNRPESIIQIPFYEPEKRIYFRSVLFRPRKGFMIQARQIDCDTLILEPKNYDVKQNRQQLPISSSSADNNNNKFIFLPSLPSICEICVTEVTGNIQSYDYPNFYPPNVNCTYRITPLPDNCMVQLRFVEFDFDYSPECNQDYLEINGIRYCGHQLKDVSMILMNKRKDDLTIRMVTSSRGAMVKPSFKGFRASYIQLPCLDTQTPSPSISNQIPHIQPATKSIAVENPQTLHPIPTPMIVHNEAIYCDQTFDDKMFEIKSPGYPYRYFDGLDCSYLIRKNSANVCRLKVTFTYFNVVGEDGNCRGDYLDIFSTRFCGILDRYTSKEIPFLQEKLLLHFHTNQQQTANGFHLALEQVDCIPGRPAMPHQKHSKTTTDEQKSITDYSGSKTNPKKLKSPNRKPIMTKNPFDYDDDEIISEFDTRNKATMEVEPHVIYEDSNKPNPTTFPTQQREEQQRKIPIRYYSRNITVINEDKPKIQPLSMMMMTTTSSPSQQRHLDDGHDYITVTTAPMTQQPQQQQQQKYDPPNTQKLCEQTFVDKIFFELKSTDLQMTRMNGGGAICHLHIRKAKTNVCQLDIMFMKYNLNDSSCGHQYLSVDGEKICGHIHETTTKRFWFQRPELYLFVNLMDIGPIDDDTFEIKVRQVECATNVDHGHHHPSSRPMQRQNENSDNHFPIKGQQQSIKSRFKQVSDIVQQIDEQQLYDNHHHHHYNDNNNNNNKPNEYKMQTYEMKQFRIPMIEQQHNHPMDADTNRPEQQQQKPYSSSETSYDPYCDLIENEMNFQIESPRDDSTITRCRYTIRKANDNVCAIDLKFQMFQLNEAMKCEREYLEIDSSRICGAFPVGHERRYHFMPNEYEKVIHFISSKSLNTRGDFRLDVKQIDTDCDKPTPTQKPTLTMPTVCDISVRNYRGHIKSPNYPAPYGDYTKCVYRIQAIGHEYCNVKLRIRDLDIELSSSDSHGGTVKCEKDWLQVDTQKLCGNKMDEQNEYTIPFEMHNGHKVAQIKFTSDAFGNGRGFDIEYKQELCVSEKMKTNLISPGQKGFRPPQIKLVKGDPYSSSPSSGGSSPSSMRPHYPPNYVSKAHMLKTMDRKEFIKMMLMAEQEQMKMKINQKGAAEEPKINMLTTMSSLDNDDNMTMSSMITTTITSIPENMVIFTTTMSTNSEDSTENSSNSMITTEPSVTMDDVTL
ncbi:uncharacterized protein LOC124491913 [Dermatophagoides farinae]|uniref:uncharacterized protein LOC124491913 n=1 Tax=Dermatophagoides farinae TaxID=6954 RepID=UPI003F60CE50